MKYVLMILAVMALAQTAKAQSWQYMPENMSLVQQGLNKDLYTYNNVLVNFSMSKNREVAHLQILNNICPKVEGGISCMAMPSLLVNATYTLTLLETDSCGVQTFLSNNVEVGSRFMREQRHFTQIRVKDFSKSICEMVYISDVKVELKDTTLDTQLNKVEIHYSTLFFNFVKNFRPVNQ
jgi:hypothetical protein